MGIMLLFCSVVEYAVLVVRLFFFFSFHILTLVCDSFNGRGVFYVDVIGRCLVLLSLWIRGLIVIARNDDWGRGEIIS